MKIYQVIQGVSGLSAGPSYSVGALAHFLADRNNTVEILALGDPPETWPFSVTPRFFKLYWNPTWGRLGFVGRDAIAFIRVIGNERAILHGHNLWGIANLFPLLVRRNSPARIIWSPRGALSEVAWTYSPVIKRLFWQLLQKRALSHVTCFHVTSIMEYKDVRRMGFSQPVAIIPNGVDIPSETPDSRKNKVLYLGRIHSIKGLDLLILVWQEIAEQFPDWELVIAGPVDSEYAEGLVRNVREHRIPRIAFAGEVRGENKSLLLSTARLLVLPSYSENFGMVVAEALAHGLPVIATTGTPWQDLAEKRCGWYVQPTREDLKRALVEAISAPSEQLERMGRSGCEWMVRDYGWPHIAEMMNDVYTWQLKGGTPPGCVVTE